MMREARNPPERIAPYLRHRSKLVRRLAFALLKAQGIELPAAVEFGEGLRLPHGAVGLVVHETTRIGNNVRLYQGVTIGRADQYLAPQQLPPEPGGVVLGDGVIVGAGASILFKAGQGLLVGRDAVIGANAVVLESVPAGEIWAGVPARRTGRNPNASAA